MSLEDEGPPPVIVDREPDVRDPSTVRGAMPSTVGRERRGTDGPREECVGRWEGEGEGEPSGQYSRSESHPMPEAS